MEHLDWLWDPCIVLFGELQTFFPWGKATEVILTIHLHLGELYCAEGTEVLLADQPSGCEMKLTFLRLSLLP